jgi:putative component of toxin-antitoxin plasmid stabilization module
MSAMQLRQHVDSKLEHKVPRFMLYLPSSKTPRGGGVYKYRAPSGPGFVYHQGGGEGVTLCLCYLAQLLTLRDNQLTVSNFVRDVLIQQRTLPLMSPRQTTCRELNSPSHRLGWESQTRMA